MANALQERYSKLLDAKLRQTIVTKDNLIFNNKHEGDAKAGVVKIPVRATETAVNDYNKATGLDAVEGTTTYLTLALNKDKAVNELIDGFDAVAVPDNIVADRIDSASYSLALQIDKDSIACLESQGTKASDKVASTDSTVYKNILKARTTLSKNGVPNENRFLIASPETMELIMQDSKYIKQGDLSQELVANGVVGKIGGFNVFESCNLGATTEFICGHSDYCHRVTEWQVPVHVQDLSGSGKYIGASAVQGRKVYGVVVSNAKAVYIKANA